MGNQQIKMVSIFDTQCLNRVCSLESKPIILHFFLFRYSLEKRKKKKEKEKKKKSKMRWEQKLIVCYHYIFCNF
jgi:hypothetical protein